MQQQRKIDFVANADSFRFPFIHKSIKRLKLKTEIYT